MPHRWGQKLGSGEPFGRIDGKLPSPVLGFLVLAVTVVPCLLVASLRRTNLGQRTLAVRSNGHAGER
jgi:branched-chain amino acid transport system permease protein